MKKPSKQRKKLYLAPLHKRHKLVSANLSKELRKKYGRRSFPVRKGDTVKIMRGQFKKRVGKVTKVNLKTLKVYVEGLEIKKKSGQNAPYPIHPSNLMITELYLEDKLRKKRLEKEQRGK